MLTQRQYAIPILIPPLSFCICQTFTIIAVGHSLTCSADKRKPVKRILQDCWSFAAGVPPILLCCQNSSASGIPVTRETANPDAALPPHLNSKRPQNQRTGCPASSRSAGVGCILARIARLESERKADAIGIPGTGFDSGDAGSKCREVTVEECRLHCCNSRAGGADCWLRVAAPATFKERT